MTKHKVRPPVISKCSVLQSTLHGYAWPHRHIPAAPLRMQEPLIFTDCNMNKRGEWCFLFPSKNKAEFAFSDYACYSPLQKAALFLTALRGLPAPHAVFTGPRGYVPRAPLNTTWVSPPFSISSHQLVVITLQGKLLHTTCHGPCRPPVLQVPVKT